MLAQRTLISDYPALWTVEDNHYLLFNIYLYSNVTGLKS